MLSQVLSQGRSLVAEYPVVAATGALLVGVFIYYHKVVVRPVLLHAKEGGRLELFLRRHLPILKERYWPTFWCFESRMQTVLASMTRRMIPYIYYRREVQLAGI